MKVDKLLGEDMELGNFFEPESLRPQELSQAGSGERAARALLEQIRGVPALATPSWSYAGGWSANSYGSGSAYESRSEAGPSESQDWGRRYLRENGGAAYIDLAHLELCTPEVRSAFDAVAAHHAMFHFASRALAGANEGCDGGRYQLLAANSDRLGNSYGSHVNVLVSRECWDDLFRRKLHPLLVLAAYQVSSIVLTGQGKLGSENSRPAVDYQISQRADFFETLAGPQTTYRRPIVNSRDEALCGRRGTSELARLHCIFYDNSLCHVATLLRFGGLQIVLAMIEAGHPNLGLALDDPVCAVVRWSHDPSLEARCALASGEAVTAVELQLRFVAAAKRCGDAGGLDTVPRAAEIIAIWEETLLALQAREWDVVAGRLDWVLKQQILQHALQKRADLTWDSPPLRHLDLLYGSLDRDEGLYWAYEAAGLVERVVGEDEILRFVESPPDDTRAWMRATLLRSLDPDQIASVDWDRIELRLPQENGYRRRVAVDLEDPRAWTRAEMEPVFAGADSPDALARMLGGERPTWTQQPTRTQ